MCSSSVRRPRLGVSTPRSEFLSSLRTPRRLPIHVDAGRIDQGDRRRLGRHGDRRVHRHAGPAHGQAAPRRVLPRGACRRPRRRGVQLPARPRHGDGSGARLRDRELGARLRRLRARAGSRHAPPGSVARGDGARPRRRRVARRLAGRSLAAAGAEATGRARGRARLHAHVRLRARVLPPARDLRGGPREALPRPDAVGPLHPRLPHPRHDLRRAAHPADAERDAGRRA